MNIEVKNSVKPIEYIRSMKILEKRVNDVYTGKKNELLWIIEHSSVYTAGSNSNDKDIRNKKIKVIKTNRGGKHTYHGPGQKVIYFVLNLNKRGKDIRNLIRKLESCIIENIVIWIKVDNEEKKIAAIGIKVKKWIAYHGFCINIENDLSKYDSIIPCGIKDKGITNFKKLGIKNYKNINSVIAKKFLNTFL